MFSLVNNSERDILSCYQKSGGVLQLGSGTNQISRKVSDSEVLFKFKTFQVERNILSRNFGILKSSYILHFPSTRSIGPFLIYKKKTYKKL